MGYGWAMVLLWEHGLSAASLRVFLGADTLGLRTLFAIIAMGCCIMKFIKDNGTR